MIYLAQPYSHPSKTVRLARFKIAEFELWRMVKAGTVAYSPIVHFHKLSELYGLPGDFDFWKAQCEGVLSCANALHVLELPGHRESKGLESELRFWTKFKSGTHTFTTWNEIQQHCAEYRDTFEDRPMLYWTNVLNEAAKI